MANNLFANTPTIGVAKQTITFSAIGITPAQIRIIYEIGAVLLSYVPGRPINQFSGFTAGKSYYIIPAANLDYEAYLYPPVAGGNTPFGNANIVCDGNSLTFGTSASNPATKSYPAVLATMTGVDGVATVVNMGVSGQRTDQMIARGASVIDVLQVADKRNILVAWEIGNDLWQNGSSQGAQFYLDRWRDYIDDRKAAGWDHIIMLNVPFRDNRPLQGSDSTPGGDSQANYDAARISINSLIPAQFTDVARIDIAGEPGFTAYYWNYYSADKLHFNDNGYAIIAQMVFNAIMQLPI